MECITSSFSPIGELVKGGAFTLPLAIGAFPFAFIFGALALQNELSMMATFSMSFFVFAGAAQFVALGLISLGSELWLIALTTLVTNLRHLIYSVWLQPYTKHLSLRWKSILSFGLVDEVFAIVSQHYTENRNEFSHFFFLGSVLFLWCIWTVSSVAGYIVGDQFPQIYELGLEVAMPITFACMVVVMTQSKTSILAVFVTGIIMLITKELPNQSGLFVASVVGVAIGAFAEKFLKEDEK
ncbi:AzlC family ABC transporter permease [Aestuariibacter sp. AA17]|uniref:AzlC family ABC transporter permease n=1 Tax=Fluctibacter corallii TaxID=2984329 RepID=A0ABT3A5R9_9ALTE|nr:AzlC family ABC transporter permease [Aestuariibacter sp. AA17]MCV2884025.1 AzlC family ABC transporter permease [Aestuariibacter sp. AA17]